MIRKNHKIILLSVVVPAYKQERTIKGDLENILVTLEKGLPPTYDFEVICVVDGQVDKTLQEAQRVSSDKLKVVAYKNNKGKGYAVRYGMSKTKGDLVSFLDAGMD